MCLTCGCMDAHLEMGEKDVRYGRSVAETFDIVEKTIAKDRNDHPQEYATS